MDDGMGGGRSSGRRIGGQGEMDCIAVAGTEAGSF